MARGWGRIGQFCDSGAEFRDCLVGQVVGIEVGGHTRGIVRELRLPRVHVVREPSDLQDLRVGRCADGARDPDVAVIVQNVVGAGDQAGGALDDIDRVVVDRVGCRK